MKQNIHQIEAITNIINTIDILVKDHELRANSSPESPDNQRTRNYFAMLQIHAQELREQILNTDSDSIPNAKKELLESKHRFIILLIINKLTLELAEFAIQNLLIDPAHPDYILLGQYYRDEDHSQKKDFLVDLLSHVLFLRGEYSEHMIRVAKILIENGDIIYSANLAIYKQPSLASLRSPEYYNDFHAMLINFYEALYPEIREYLVNLGLERSFSGRKFICKISNKFPTIPVRHRGELYDLIFLADKLRPVPNRTTPYAFCFDGKTLDTKEITFDRQYFTDMKQWINNTLPNTVAFEQAFAIMSHNSSKLCLSLFVSAFFSSIYYFVNDNCPTTEQNQNQLLQLFCIHGLSQALYLQDKGRYLATDADNNPNSYINKLKTFNKYYAYSSMFLAAGHLFSRIQGYNLHKYLPVRNDDSDVLSITFLPYLLAFAAYTIGFIMQTKVYKFREISSKPTVQLQSNYGANSETRRQILLSGFYNFKRTANEKSHDDVPNEPDIQQGVRSSRTNSIGYI